VIPNVFTVVGDPIRLALVASQPAKRQPHWSEVFLVSMMAFSAS
jgi:hypothetical protein